MSKIVSHLRLVAASLGLAAFMAASGAYAETAVNADANAKPSLQAGVAKPAGKAAMPAAGATVNINTADEQALVDRLNGIGPAKAKAIIEYRTKNGPFKSVEELTEVKGIGPATLEKNRALITLK